MDEPAPHFLKEIWANKWVKLVTLILALATLWRFVLRIRHVLTALAVAWVLAYICKPLVDRLERRGLPRSAAIGLLSFFLLAALVATDLIAVPVVGRELAALGDDLPSYADALNAIVPRVESALHIELPRTHDELRAFVGDNRETIDKIAKAVYSPLTHFLKGAVTGVMDFITKLLTLLVVPIAWFYLLRDMGKINDGVIELTPARWRGPFVEFMKQVDEIASNFLRGQITVALILATLYSLGLWLILHIPLGLLIGVVAGCAAIVPYMGLIVGVVPALLLALLKYQDWQHPLGVIAVFGVAQALEGNLITPKVVGDKLGLHPVTVIFALLVWAELAGFLGMLIAVPATAVIQVLLTRLVRRLKAAEAGGDAAAR
jgi:predicted PurR-regulated permease PerM